MKKIALMILAGVVAAGCSESPVPADVTREKVVSPLASLAVLGTVHDRFQAYNVEMVEVTGGRFWAPYDGPAEEVYRYREPLDLTDERIRHLAQHLAPSLMRVSGTWANNTYVALEGESAEAVPEGFKQVLTTDQWRGVVAFSKAVDAPIVTSFAASSGTREEGQWVPAQAQRLLDLTRAEGGALFAAEFFNEPNVVAAVHGIPPGYAAEDYGRDFRVFAEWARSAAPEMQVLGPGGVNEDPEQVETLRRVMGSYLLSSDLMSQNPDSVDVVSYHYYGAISQRCAAMGISSGADPSQALAAEWLDKTGHDADAYAALRDQFEPGKPIWLTETAQAACGGSPWASTFLDSFRYLNQLGLLAQKGVQVVMHNTLSASDYALIDQDTLEPRPNYWSAVLWRKLMDRTVLASPPATAPTLKTYAHCLRNAEGGVGILAINTGDQPGVVELGAAADIWVMTADQLDSSIVSVNGATPSVTPEGDIAGLTPVTTEGRLTVPSHAIAFAAVAAAEHPECR